MTNYTCGVALRNCNVHGNSAGGVGGGIIAGGSSTVIENCKIDSNSAGSWGGGLYSTHDILVKNCSFIGNSAGEIGGSIGGAIICYAGRPAIINCSFLNNWAQDGCAIGLSPWLVYDPHPIVTNCIMWDSSGNEVYLGAHHQITITYSAICGGWPGIGNISEDPLFYSTVGDSACYLTANSPCIDAGDPNSPLDPDGTRCDMGAYYFAQGAVAPHPDMIISDNVLGFGNVRTQTSLSLPLFIANVGNANLIIYDVATSDLVFTTDFETTDSLVAPGDTLELAVTFTPAQLRLYEDSLTIKSNDDTVDVNLLGEGVNSVISVSADTLDFGLVYIGQHSDRALFIYNLGNSELSIYGITASDTCFATDFGPADSVIAPNDSLVVTVSFAPGDSINYEDSLFIFNSGELVILCLRGEGRYPVGISGDKNHAIPDRFALHPPFPAPCNSTASLRYDLPVGCRVSLDIYDVAGRLVGNLLKGWRMAGYHVAGFDGAKLASGIYIYHFTAGNFTASGKMILMK